MNNNLLRNGLVAGLVFIHGFVFPQEEGGYKLPPPAIQELVDAPGAPELSFSPSGEQFLMLTPPSYPSLKEISMPIIGLAGLRVNPKNSTTEAEVSGKYSSMILMDVNGEERLFKGLPQEYRAGDVQWSPDGAYLAFSNTTDNGVELWLADLKSMQARQLIQVPLNAILGEPFEWLSDSKNLLVKLLIEDRGEVPEPSPVPVSPVIQENLGKTTPSRTYQYLLQDPHDESLMDFYLTSQLALVSLDGSSSPIGEPAIFRKVSRSPDDAFLLVERIVKPYSYLVPINYFPYHAEVWDKKGGLVKKLHEAALNENMPIGFDAAASGPRSFQWRNDAPAELFWIEALDGGDPEAKVDFHDAVYRLRAPFNSTAEKLFGLKFRFAGFHWLDDDGALVEERWRKSRRSRLSLFSPDKIDTIQTITERSSEDTYSDPGHFVSTKNAYNKEILLRGKKKGLQVFTIGNGASAEGDRPFLLGWNLGSDQKDTLFRSQAPFYEEPVHFMNSGQVVISRESADDNPNYFLKTLKGGKEKPLTHIEHPYPGLKGVKKELLSYKRKDGVPLSASLYLPADFKQGDPPLPVLIWAYPREFKSLAAAGQVKGSPYRFTRLAFRSPVFWVTQGYAILDQADMPIVGEGDQEPNDTFIEQIEMNAVALIDYVVGRGVADRERIAVGGHSYGAFMTANLLAHTDLFAAGIARSGAYNRTLTPFGFQGESRTYWQAKEVYDRMSPFTYADRIKKPLLITHGADDENSGTFPIQSERLYSAIKGHGGTVRFVLLPKEFHGYRSRESLMHTFYEQDAWLDRYVKNKKSTHE